MVRIDGGGHGRAEIDVAEREHEVAGVEADAVDGGEVGEIVDAADELDVARAPRRVFAHDLGVFLDGEQGGLVFPGEREVDDARGHLHVVHRRELGLGAQENLEQALGGEEALVEVDLDGADAGREIEDAVEAMAFEPGLQRVGAHAQGDVEVGVAVFDEDVGVTLAAINDGGRRGSRRNLVNDGWLRQYVTKLVTLCWGCDF